MVVAAGAADGEAEDGCANVLHHLVEAVEACLPDGCRFLAHLRRRGQWRSDEEPGGRINTQGVSGKLLKEKAIVGQVAVEGVDHPVAIRPGMLAECVVFIAPRVGVADDVEPVLRPAFAVSRRSEQPIDERLHGLQTLVGDERLDLVGGGRKAGEIERQTAYQRATVGGGRLGKATRGEFGSEKTVDRVVGE